LHQLYLISFMDKPLSFICMNKEKSRDVQSCLNYLLILIVILFSSVIVNGQSKTVNFGFQIEPIIPNKLFRIEEQIYNESGVVFSITPNPGVSYGGVVQFGLDDRFALETGMNYLRRSFTIDVDDNGFKKDLTFVADNFEVPLTIIYYVRLGEKLFMGHSVGVSFQLLPSSLYSRNAGDIVMGNPEYELEQISVRKYWVVTAFKGSFGFEYRTEKKGYFFIGPVYHLFNPLYNSRVNYSRNTTSVKGMKINAIGDYFGLVFRYSFPPSSILKKEEKP